MPCRNSYDTMYLVAKMEQEMVANMVPTLISDLVSYLVPDLVSDVCTVFNNRFKINYIISEVSPTYLGVWGADASPEKR